MFRGISTAIITPFTKGNKVDEEGLRRLVEFQEENGIDTIVPCGSTGESAMLSHDEHIHVIEVVVDHVKKAKVLAGAGSNSTSEAVMLSKRAEDLGVDGLLSISPYYVRPTQEGIYQHFKAIAESVNIPVVVYNIPGRTASNVTAETMLRMAEIEGIKAVKEASGNLEQIKEIIRKRPKGFEVLSGDDAFTPALIRSGGDGVISVTSNCLPRKMSELVNALLSGNNVSADKMVAELTPVFDALFIETNPIPIKYVMSKMGYGTGAPRLPLTRITDKSRVSVDAAMKNIGAW
ncbi:4-hydroxy-tetrahydrodipicolinate synthase [Candidatus Methanoplasma termitum]|uniref:4-hydroxy-tetrahydrodipicolinate synthase n=1 Tax=Candidatus Methanoplasma termitum TaxID=1577791 RepID=A0A0A7LAD9_9ARCH|nr:4-hydroxy-tetrahydrodipicolinate synthase [Candidatus Methanoplasma termitum]AIZ55988.1 4-hydroxy-tetrahydrodipicolinate synthase [Candidatus Methanoplasma termitum]MCL2334164.1 4-hydroxy-tetrahydrodipicolinate synthase [Candidatus Methanoplasma sp.]